MSKEEWAAALLKDRRFRVSVVEDTAKSARGVVAPWQIERLYQYRDASYDLFLRGDITASMWAGQAMWEVANFLDSAMVDRRAIRAGRTSVRMGDKGTAKKISEAAAIHADWQARAEAIWNTPQHRNKTKAEVARLIAVKSENKDTIRKAIKKPVITGGND